MSNPAVSSANPALERQQAQEVFDSGRRSLTRFLAWSGLGLFLVGGVITTAAAFYDPHNPGGPLLPFIFIIGILAMGAVLLLLQRRQNDMAANLLVYGYTAIIYLSALFGTSGPPETTWPSMIFFALVVLWAGLLIGPRSAFVVATLASALYYFTAAFLEVPPGPQPTGFLGLPDYFITRAQAIDTRVLVVYYSIAFATAFFARSSQRLTDSLSERALSLAAALDQLQQKQRLERQTGAAIVEVMNQLGTISTRQLSSVHEQVSALAEVTSTIEELSQTALAIAEAAAGVDSSAEQALQAVSASQAAVNDSLQAMLLLKVQMQAIVERILALNNSIGRISEVTNVVANIAAQTHLLALNAAIEAAGAGPAGERFAIVASEVKKLAQRSQSEASKIRDLVVEVERANVASVMATEQGLKDSDKGSAQARLAADANLEVIDIVSATTARAKTITISTQQQRSASSQVVDTMRHLRIAASEVADTTTVINQAINELASLASQLGPPSPEHDQPTPDATRPQPSEHSAHDVAPLPAPG